MRTQTLLKANIAALLKSRGQTQQDLAQWCRRTNPWLSKALSDKPPKPGEKERGLPMKYLDRIADFFGIQPYQLLQPGITPLLERRSAVPRRSGQDRRVTLVHAALRDPVQATRALVLEIASLSPQDRAALEAHLLELRLPRSGAPNTTASASAPASEPPGVRPTRRTRQAHRG